MAVKHDLLYFTVPYQALILLVSSQNANNAICSIFSKRPNFIFPILKTRFVYCDYIDEHGFQMLHQLRWYPPQPQNIMMGRTTFETFQNYTVGGRQQAILKPEPLDQRGE